MNLSEMDMGTCFSAIRCELNKAREENRRVCFIRDMHEVAVEKYGDEYKLLGTMVRNVEIVKEVVSEEHYNRRYLQKQVAKAEWGKDRL